MQTISDFFSAWGLSDDTERTGIISRSFAADGTYADPRTPDIMTGAEAISEYVAMFSANAPGWTAHVVKSDETAGTTRVTVAFGGPAMDGSDKVQYGQYFAKCNARGQITELTGFAGTGAPE